MSESQDAQSRDEPASPGPAQSGAEQMRDSRRAARRDERRRLLASGPPSPCISICRLDEATGWCIGCVRTIDEIRDWMILTPAERYAVLARVAIRRGTAATGASGPPDP
jgi:predicted Fe-S protein YdhL (DUF1289 family)